MLLTEWESWQFDILLTEQAREISEQVRKKQVRKKKKKTTSVVGATVEDETLG